MNPSKNHSEVVLMEKFVRVVGSDSRADQACVNPLEKACVSDPVDRWNIPVTEVTEKSTKFFLLRERK